MAEPLKRRKPEDEDFLEAMGAALDEYDREKAQPEDYMRRVMRRRGDGKIDTLETSDREGEGPRVVEGIASDADLPTLQKQRYDWADLNSYEATRRATAGPVKAPPGKTPFYIGDKAEHAADPAKWAPETLASQMLDWRQPGPSSAPPPPTAPAAPAQQRPARATAPRRPVVGSTTTGSQPELRPHTQLAHMAPGLDRVAERSPLVAEALARRAAPPPAPADELSQAREQANASTLATRMARAGAMANEALSGAKYDRGAYDDLEATAQQPLEDLQMRRQMGREDSAEARAQSANARAEAANERDELEAQQKADLYEPASERSRNARLLLLTRYPDKAKTLPPGSLTKMSAADVAEFLQGFDRDASSAAAERRHGEDMNLRQAALAESRADRTARQTAAEDERNQRHRQRLEQRDVQTREQDLQKLAQRTEGMSALKDDLSRIIPYVNDSGDVPGVGPAVSALPEFFLSQEGTNVRQAAIRLYRNVVRAESGQTVTPQEAASALEGMGMGAGKSEGAWRSGMSALARRAQAALQNAEAGFRPEVVAERSRRGGTTSADIPQAQPRPTGETIAMPNGEVYQVLENGDTKRIR